jgi:hypothetical protein
VTWFRVDDGFYSHPKTLAVSLAATGLWVRAGSWVGRQLNDGIVPESALRAISPESPQRTKRLADELVAAGLWLEIPGGYCFHDWRQSNPLRDEVEANRERVREWRRKRRETGNGDAA